MFGTVVIHQPELKFKDFALYRSFYCGLCRSLKERYGVTGQATLSYDMTFLALLLSALYEPETTESTTFCLVHPLQKHAVRANRFVDYAADMNILLAYWQRLDGWTDDRKPGAKLGADLLKKAYRRAKERYPDKAQAVEDYVRDLTACEKENSCNLDEAAGLTGKMLGEIFVFQEDEWSAALRRVGFYLGKFIYLSDAYEDLDKDLEKGAYNPWRPYGKPRAALADTAKDALNMMMSECCLAFEYLPIIEYEDILRNILYAGVWQRYEAAVAKDSEKAKKDAADDGGKAKDAAPKEENDGI